MAVAFSAGQSFDATFDAAGTAVDNAFDAGTGSDRHMEVSVTWNISASNMPSVTAAYNGVSMTSHAAANTTGNLRKQSFHLVAPATGSNTLRIDPAAGLDTSTAIIEVLVYTGVDQTTPFDGFTTNVGTDASAPMESTLTVTSASGDHAVVFHSVLGTGAMTSAAPTGYTERLDNVNGTLGATAGDEPGAASVATTATWTPNNNINFNCHGMNLNVAAGAASPTGPLLPLLGVG